jgi:competence protein ComEA
MKLAPPNSNTDADPAKAVGRTRQPAQFLREPFLADTASERFGLPGPCSDRSHDRKGVVSSKGTRLAFCFLAAALLAVAADDDAKLLPESPGKDVIVRTCLECHDAASFRKKRLNRDAWTETVGQMVDQGADATSDEQTTIIEYLVHNFGPDSKVRINTAPFSEIRMVLGFTNEETKAIIAYRDQHGDFKELRDLLNVPGVDSKKVEAKKEMLAF